MTETPDDTAADPQQIIAELQRKLNERTAERDEATSQQAATTDILKVISRSTFDLQAVLDALTESATRLCKADMATITRKGEGDDFYHVTNYNFPADWVGYARKHPFKSGRGSVLGLSLIEKRAIQVADVLADPEYTRGEQQKRAGFRTVLAVPLQPEGKPIGVFILCRRTVSPFSDKQIELMSGFADQAVIAIENARLFNETKEALERQTATADILKVIASSPADVQPVFHAIATSANRLIGGHSTTVLRIVGDMAELAAFTSVSLEADAALRALFPRPIFASDMQLAQVLQGEVMEITDTEGASELITRNLARARGFRSRLLVPLRNDNDVLGVISITRKEPGAFAKHDVELLQTFADQAVIAIENVRLFNETKEALEHQAATSEVLQVISGSMADAQPVFERIIDSIERLFDFKTTAIFLAPGDGRLHLAARRGTSVELLDALYPMPMEQTAGYHVIHERSQMYFHDVINGENVPISLRRVGEAMGNFSGVITPMFWQAQNIGTIAVTREPNMTFSAKELSLLQTFADQAVIAIENARLFNEVQAKTRNLTEALEQQTATSEILQVISSSQGELDPVFTKLLENATRVCGASFGTMNLYENGEFRQVARYNVPNYGRPEVVRPHPESALATAARTRRVVQIEDIRAGAPYREGAPEVQLMAAAGARTLFVVPMLRGDELLGTITIYRQEVRLFTDQQIELVANFARQAVIAIENARLLKELRGRTDDLSASLQDLRTAQDRLVQTEKLASLGQLTAGIAHEIKNPLNFVNNFSALSAELVGEMSDVLAGADLDKKTREELDELAQILKGNLEKVVQHGKRADSIVKNMLLHSREGSGEHRATDINALVEESLNLAYHGARAEKAGFEILLQRNFDSAVGMAEVYPQEITRALLNLISNGFYAATRRATEAGDDFKPVLTAATRSLGDKIEIRIHDNGIGIPAEAKAKIFNPFFTTKPSGEGTGLGLSMSHDIIVKQHGGSIDVETEPGLFTEFKIVLPRANQR